MTSKSGIWYVIINPNAGRRRGAKDWPVIARLLEEADIRFEPVFTARRHHAIELTKEAIAGGRRKFVVTGGDGTMNEVVNGILEQQEVPSSHISLGMISIGTGNDWARMFGIPLDYAGAVATLRREKTFLQDAGIVRYYQHGLRYKQFFINIAGLGFDAVVVQKANLKKDKGKSGMMVYMRTLLAALASYRHTHTTINIDGREFSDDVFTISIGIGKYSGGGMMQTPDAIADDGYFDVTVIRKIGKLDIIRHIKMLFDGSLPQHPKVSTCRARKILIDSVPEIHLEVDGESLGHSPIEIEILQKGVRVITGHDFPQQG